MQNSITMEIQGKVIELLKEQSGEGRNGKWRKREYVIETQDQYPKKVCFNMWGDRIDQFQMKEGDVVNVHFDIESREFNGRWYTDVKAWKVEQVGAGTSDLPPLPDQGATEISSPDLNPPPPGEDDLPF